MGKSSILGKRIKELSEQKGIDAKNIAEACGEPERKVLRAMYGSLGCEGIHFLVKLCKALDVSLDELFDTDEMRETFK